jgi:hypothetical protein
VSAPREIDEKKHLLNRQLPACTTVIDVIGNFLTSGRQLQKLLLGSGVTGRFSQLSIFGRFLPVKIGIVHATPPCPLS